MTTLTFSAGAAAFAPQAASNIEATTNNANILNSLFFICSSKSLNGLDIEAHEGDISLLASPPCG
jgi:hypothetical protein